MIRIEHSDFLKLKEQILFHAVSVVKTCQPYMEFKTVRVYSLHFQIRGKELSFVFRQAVKRSNPFRCPNT